MRWLVLPLVVLLIVPNALAQEELDEVDLVPDDQANWSPRNLVVALTAVLGRWNYWYGERRFELETVPAEAEVGLFYIRANFQKRYEQAVTPVRVRVPKRSDTTRKDYVTIRGHAPGFETTTATYSARDLPDKILLELKPLANRLIALGSSYIDDRSSLFFHTTEEPVFRITRASDAAIVLALTKTANKLPSPPEIDDGLIQGVTVSQAGEDILIRIDAREGEPEFRSKMSYDPVRSEHIFTLDLALPGATLPSPDEIRERVARVRFRPDDPCVGIFEDEIRASIARPDSSSRTPGGLVGLYRRQAMLRLGSLQEGEVRTVGGEVLRTGHPVELELALQQGSEVRGYIAFLDAFAASLDAQRSSLRSLLDTDLSVGEFKQVWASADRARATCATARAPL